MLGELGVEGEPEIYEDPYVRLGLEALQHDLGGRKS
jgi:hypothetical protein